MRNLGTVTLGLPASTRRRGMARQRRNCWRHCRDALRYERPRRHQRRESKAKARLRRRCRPVSKPPRGTTAHGSSINPSTRLSAISFSKQSLLASCASSSLPFPLRARSDPYVAHRGSRERSFPRTTFTSVRTSCRSEALHSAIGVLIDAAIVMVENGYRHLAERDDITRLTGRERRGILVRAPRSRRGRLCSIR